MRSSWAGWDCAAPAETASPAPSFVRFRTGLHVRIGSVCLDDSGFAAMHFDSVSRKCLGWLSLSG